MSQTCAAIAGKCGPGIPESGRRQCRRQLGIGERDVRDGEGPARVHVLQIIRRRYRLRHLRVHHADVGHSHYAILVRVAKQEPDAYAARPTGAAA